MLGLTPFSRSLTQRKSNDMLDFFNVMDDFFNAPFTNKTFYEGSFKLDVKEDEKTYYVEAELPGIKKEEIKLDYAENRFLIAIEKNEELNDETKQYVHRERRSCSMQRAIYLKDINVSEIQAKLEEGVLKVRIPKLESKTQKYEITIE